MNLDSYDLDGAPSVEFTEDAHDQRKLRGAILSDAIGRVKRGRLVSLAPSTSIADALHAMNEHRVGCALIVEHDEIAGIFTERDVLRRVAGKLVDLSATPVSSVMTRSPSTLPETALVAFALRKMVAEGYRHIPLVAADGKRPVGVVAVRDIVAWIVDLLPEAVSTLPSKP